MAEQINGIEILPAPVVPDGHVKCDWQGYGFGASYMDAGCINGKICDLDDGEEGGVVYIHEHYEPCPQCGGAGHHPADAELLGPMAYIRAESRREVEGLLESVDDQGLRAELAEHFDGLFALIRKLEN